jgi:hypothetical protein
VGSLFDDIDFGPSVSVGTTALDSSGLATKVVGSGNEPTVFAFDTGLNGGSVQLGNKNEPLPRGILHVTASFRNGVVTMACVEHATSTSFDVFWLPWDVSKVNFVSWDELDSSGVDCFMTVPLSGCAVVIAATGLLHVTADAYRQTAQDTVLRLATDSETIGAASFPRAYTWGIRDWPQGYTKPGIASRGLVFGFKVQGVWYFYFLARVNADGQYSWESGVRAE